MKKTITLFLIAFFIINITSCYELKRNVWEETVKEKLYAFQNSDGGFKDDSSTSPSSPQATYKSLYILTKLGYEVKNPDIVEEYLRNTLKALLKNPDYHPLVMLNTLKALQILSKDKNIKSIPQELDPNLYEAFLHNTYQSLEEQLNRQDFEQALYDISNYAEILVMLGEEIPDTLKQKIYTNSEKIIGENLKSNTTASILPLYYSVKLLDNINIISSYNQQIDSLAKKLLNQEINKAEKGDLLISYYAMMTQKYNHVPEEPLLCSNDYLNFFKSASGGVRQNSGQPPSLSMTEKYIQMTSFINSYRMKTLDRAVEGYDGRTMSSSISGYKLRRLEEHDLILLKLYNAEHGQWNKYYITDGKTKIPAKTKVSHAAEYNDIVVFQIPKGAANTRLFFYFSEKGYTEVPRF